MQIYLDMDGVTTNFLLGTRKIHNNFDSPAQQWDWWNDWNLTTDEFWEKIDSDLEFWYDLEPHDWLDELLIEVEKIDPEYRVLTSPRNTPQCYSGKHYWVEKYLGIVTQCRRFCPYGQKAELARPDRILIDDADHNIDSWESAGGIGVLFPQPWNTCRHKCSDRMRWVKTRLFDIESIA